jgi:hypothetical protein
MSYKTNKTTKKRIDKLLTKNAQYQAANVCVTNSKTKKEKYEINLRIGTVTVLEISFCPCPACEKKGHCKRFRFMILNFGFEL